MTTIAFLTGEDHYDIDLPEQFQLCESRAVVTVGHRWRALTYRADASQRPDHNIQLRPILSEVSPTGVPATVYDDLQGPGGRILAWTTQNGVLITYFNPDELDAVAQYLNGIHVSDNPLPRISFQAPLRGGDLRDAEQRDEIVFTRGSAGEEQTLAVSRLPNRQQREANPRTATGWVALAVDTDVGLRVVWGGPADVTPEIEEGVSRVASSIAQIE